MTMKWKLLSLFIFFYTLGESAHPIYIVLTHPRATGTAFEKIMRTQKETAVLHAPFFDTYLLKKYGSDHPFTRDLPTPAATFDDVRAHLFELALERPVFFKESGYLLLDYLCQHPDFYQHPQVKIAFLVRDPAKSILSFYRKMANVNESIIGHRQLWELFTLLKEELGEVPMVIDSDELLKNPLPILNHLGKSWGLQFDETNLCWDSGCAEDWHLKDWYAEVGASTKLASYQGDVPRQEDGTPEYAEVSDLEDRKRLQELYRSQNVYYQKILQFSIHNMTK